MKLLGIELKGSYRVEFEDLWLEVYDENGNEIYSQFFDGGWYRNEFDSDGNVIYYEDDEKYWEKSEYDSNGNRVYHENSEGFWEKSEYDKRGNLVLFTNSVGLFIDKRVRELTLEEIESLLGYKVKIKGE